MDRNSESLGSRQNRISIDCPDPRLWYELASGELASESAPLFIQHATDCKQCGGRLAAAVSDLKDDTTPGETQEITELESAQPEWQSRLAHRLVGTLTPEPALQARLTWRAAPRWAWAAAALLAVVIAGYRYGFRPTPEKQVGQLLAQAASERRFSELRMVGSQYAPLGQGLTREPTATFLSSPGALLKAEALIYDQLISHPSDAFWLHSKARADLLDGKYDAAQATLTRALQLSPKSPDILTDLAIAHSEQKNYAAAYEDLSQVLASRPDDPVALFNRAVVSESQFLYRQALDDWERYLKVDPNSPWAGEARERAEKVHQILKTHDQSLAEPLLSPAQLAESADDADQVSKVDARIEGYLDAAVQEWLPRAYPEASRTTDPKVRQALFFLADLTSRQHNDVWLSDLLQSSSSANFPSAVVALARASRANDVGDYETSREQALKAERLFRLSDNRAGELRAQFEHILANQLTGRAAICWQQATAGWAKSQGYSYAWLNIQLSLERGVCSLLMGDIGADQNAARRAIDQARKNKYGSLYLRATFFAADDKHFAGDQRGASRLAHAGIQSFWSGQFPPMRGYNLYLEVAEIAKASDWPNLQLAAFREATALIDSGDDLLLRAWGHNSIADAASVARYPEVAEAEYANAGRLFALAPRTEASRKYEIETAIHIAQLEARTGRFDDAIVRLTAIQDRIRPLSNNVLEQKFYATLGELQLGRHREHEAEQALRPALALAERNLTTLRSEAERSSWSKGAALSYHSLIQAELVQGRSQEALEVYEWFLGAPQRVAGASPRRPVADASIPDPPPLGPRLALLTKETVVAFAVLPGGLAIWVYDDRGINARWIPRPTDDLRDLATRFHDLSSDPKSEMSALRRDARSLYEALIAPVEQHFVPGRTLVIEAEGWLAHVPFEALLDLDGRYLIERAPIVYSLGQDSDSRLRSNGRISVSMPALVVGSAASSTADGLIALPDVAREAESVASGFHSTTLLKGGAATLSAVRHELPGATVFHFAGHSLATPDRAGLILAGETLKDAPLLLNADAVRRIKLPNMRLAVLSACTTAAGTWGSSGFESITETLLRAGVPHVVASRWVVDSVEARAFVEDFYRNALAGHSVSDATRMSSQKMLSNPRTAHPYYWSAFAAYGRP